MVLLLITTMDSISSSTREVLGEERMGGAVICVRSFQARIVPQPIRIIINST